MAGHQHWVAVPMIRAMVIISVALLAGCHGDLDGDSNTAGECCEKRDEYRFCFREDVCHGSRKSPRRCKL